MAEVSKVQALANVEPVQARAVACQRFLENGRETLREVLGIRDRAIREMREAGMRRAAIAAALGVQTHVVTDALRQPR